MSIVLAFVAGAAVVVAVQSLPRPADRQSLRLEPSRSHDAPGARIPSARELPPDDTNLPKSASHESPLNSTPTSTTASTTQPPANSLPPQQVNVPPDTPDTNAGPRRYPGITEPAPGRYSRLSLATSQPVAFVDVKPGDRVKKGWQVFSHWESPERLQAMKREVERVQKQRDIARTRSTAADQALSRIEKLSGAVSPQELQDAQSTATVRRAELEAAEIAVLEIENRFAAMDFEFKQAFVTSPIEGIVATVDVVQGERRQVGEGFRGVTVLDPRVLTCRCLLTPEHAAELKSESVESLQAVVEFGGRNWAARLSTIGVLADRATGLIPVLLEVPNPDESLPCGVRVQVRFTAPMTEPTLTSTP